MEPHPTVPHLEVGADGTATTMHRAGKVDDMFALDDDLRVVQVGHDAHQSRAGESVSGQLVSAVVRTTVLVGSSVIVPQPEGLLGIGVPIAEGHDDTIAVSQLFVRDADEPASLGEGEPRIGQREQGQLRVVTQQTLGDLRDSGEVGIERFELQLTTEAAVPQALGLDHPRVARLAGDAPGGDLAKEGLQLRTETGTSLVQIQQMPDLFCTDVTHAYSVQRHPL